MIESFSLQLSTLVTISSRCVYRCCVPSKITFYTHRRVYHLALGSLAAQCLTSDVYTRYLSLALLYNSIYKSSIASFPHLTDTPHCRGKLTLSKKISYQLSKARVLLENTKKKIPLPPFGINDACVVPEPFLALKYLRFNI
jgi:hypothetical protein